MTFFCFEKSINIGAEVGHFVKTAPPMRHLLYPVVRKGPKSSPALTTGICGRVSGPFLDFAGPLTISILAENGAVLGLNCIRYHQS